MSITNVIEERLIEKIRSNLEKQINLSNITDNNSDIELVNLEAQNQEIEQDDELKDDNVIELESQQNRQEEEIRSINE
jgi:hypothetical protein